MIKSIDEENWKQWSIHRSIPEHCIFFSLILALVYFCSFVFTPKHCIVLLLQIRSEEKYDKRCVTTATIEEKSVCFRTRKICHVRRSLGLLLLVGRLNGKCRGLKHYPSNEKKIEQKTRSLLFSVWERNFLFIYLLIFLHLLFACSSLSPQIYLNPKSLCMTFIDAAVVTTTNTAVDIVPVTVIIIENKNAYVYVWFEQMQVVCTLDKHTSYDFCEHFSLVCREIRFVDLREMLRFLFFFFFVLC